jgi:beta-lactamase superfamily II metal-dependent hydrolase
MGSDMDFEVEFHPVGDASKAGDAILARYGINGQYQVIVIDGGTDDSGEAIVEHIKRVYGPNTTIEHVICTHPDSDHACGLRCVMRELPVKTLWLHGVWHHAQEMLPYFEDKRWTADGLAAKIRSEYSVIAELVDLADRQRTPVYEPFEGQQIGPFTVLSPTRWAYLRLVPQFRKTPAPDVDALKLENMWIEPAAATGLAALLGNLMEKAIEWVPEWWDLELLKDGAVTAAENESSTVLYGRFGTASVLLTADVGVNALWWAMDYADRTQIDLSALNLVQVPHHGSRSNVGPSVLDRLLGIRQPNGLPEKRRAIVSVPKDDANHPRRMVMNAFLRRGAPVCRTQGSYYRYYHGNMLARPGEFVPVPFGFFDRVEAYD